MVLSDVKNLKNMLDYSSEHFPNNDFMLFRADGVLHRRSYSDFKRASDAFSKMLLHYEMNHAHIAIIGDTSFSWICSYFGTVSCGGVIVPLASKDTDSMNIELMKFGDVRVLVFDKKHYSLYEKAKTLLPNISLFVCTDDSCADKCVLNFSDIANTFSGEYRNNPDAEKMCTLLFTSGTTGFPKGVMLSHKNLVSNTLYENEPDTAKRVFCCLPVNHAFCFTANFLRVIFRGATVCLCTDLSNLLADIQFFKPESIVAVPQIVNKLMNGAINYSNSRSDISEQEAVSEYFGGCKKIICGGAPLEAELTQKYVNLGMPVLNGYGMSECSPIISSNALVLHRYGSVGKPIPCNKVKISNGEILVKGNSVMLGYYKNPDATREAFTQDGWLHTGDIGHIDSDGFLYITGRCKNLILLSNGENVSAEFLEGRFVSEPFVSEIVTYGEEGAICAEVFPDSEYIKVNGITDLHEEMKNVLERVNSNLAVFQRITDFYIRESPFERTVSSKIKRNSLHKIRHEVLLPKTQAEKTVCKEVSRILNIKSVGVNDNFFALGGSSLTVTELAVGLHITPQSVFTHPILKDIALFLEQGDNDKRALSENINSELIQSFTSEHYANNCKSVLLTGATGYLGIHILKELLDRGCVVYCFVRNAEKLFSMIDFYFGKTDTRNIRIVVGNIEDDFLGLDKATYNRLAMCIDGVFHIAANVSHSGDYQEIKKTNVIGTQNIIAFASNASAVLHHTSTVSVHGAATTAQKCKNSVFNEHTLDIGQHYYDNVYIRSKYHAEKAVIRARSNGLKANIYRIGNLTWRKTDGKFQMNDDDNGFLHRAKAILKLGMLCDTSDKYPMDLTPVDECAKAFVSLAFAGRVNETYHLLNTNYLCTRDLFLHTGHNYKYVSSFEMAETVLANTGDRDIQVYLFYLLMSSRSQSVEINCDFTKKRLAEVGFCWSVPNREYLMTGETSNGTKKSWLSFAPVKINPMRKTGNEINPFQNIALGLLKDVVLPNQKLFEGENALADLNALIYSKGIRNPFVITFGHANENPKICEFLHNFSECVLFNKVGREPSLETVENCLDLYFFNRCDGVIAIGGGAVLDCAKLISLRAGNDRLSPDSLCGFFAEPKPAVPLFAIPTTAGTGSEVTLFSMINDESKQKKEVYISNAFLPCAIALVPELTTGLSTEATVFGGIDALSHCVESFLSLFGDAFPNDRKYALKAAKTIFSYLRQAVFEPDNIVVRGRLLKAAYEAGLAFRRIETGYIHALAHRLGEKYGYPHGYCISAVMVPILKAYLPYGEKDMAELARYCGIAEQKETDQVSAEKFINEINKLITDTVKQPLMLCLSKDEIANIIEKAQDEAKAQGTVRPFSDAELSKILSEFKSE